MTDTPILDRLHAYGRFAEQYLSQHRESIAEDIRLRHTDYDIYRNVADGVWHNLQETGKGDFCVEISKHETKSGNPELFYFATIK